MCGHSVEHEKGSVEDVGHGEGESGTRSETGGGVGKGLCVGHGVNGEV